MSIPGQVDNLFAIESIRLKLRWLEFTDADFIYRLVNDPHWLRFIGDKQVADLDGARRYIEDGPRAMYRQFGFGLNRVALKDDDTPIGVCGLLQRESLPHPDLGFAFLPEYRGQGYAREAADAILQHAYLILRQTRVAAIVNPDNHSSINLLKKLGFCIEKQIQIEPNPEYIDLYIVHAEP
jgi:RimJ/RimL family protein N-acetyltransferase